MATKGQTGHWLYRYREPTTSELVYLGETAQPWRRRNEHRAAATRARKNGREHWYRDDLRYEEVHFPAAGQDEILRIEAEAIDLENPRFNRRRPEYQQWGGDIDAEWAKLARSIASTAAQQSTVYDGPVRRRFRHAGGFRIALAALFGVYLSGFLAWLHFTNTSAMDSFEFWAHVVMAVGLLVHAALATIDSRLAVKADVEERMTELDFDDLDLHSVVDADLLT